ncbi:RNA polymerase II elongation factor ELL2-like [Passer domesticus]|uniref:RNA polymerase II elongation factor ELL2-like n=1 Tax=Passer domesticus TaxID=48849 RepID=UPI0030FE7B0A
MTFLEVTTKGPSIHQTASGFRLDQSCDEQEEENWSPAQSCPGSSWWPLFFLLSAFHIPLLFGHASKFWLHFPLHPCGAKTRENSEFRHPSACQGAEEIPNSNRKKNELGRLKQLHPLDFDEGKRTDTSIASTCSATSNQADYLRKYGAIVSLEQRQCYKDDFNAEYEEYRNLYLKIDKIIKKFRQFQEQWKSLTPGSKAYQLLCQRILADYQQLQQGSPSYSEMRSRCQYLHKKLAHIQGCISEFEQQ